MIEYIRGNLFESKAKVLVNPVNTVGIMGKGLALQFRKKYPHTYSVYKAACKSNLLMIGKLMITHEEDRDILLFPTKTDWKLPSKIEYIEAGLKKLVISYREKEIKSIAFPKLGCGLGGLDWNDVKQLMEKYLKSLPIDCYIYI